MVFVSYSHFDDSWRQQVELMAKPLARSIGIEFWSDQAILPGKKWEEEIERAMHNATVAIFLVSDNFLASDFITGVELPFFLHAADKNKVTIIWVLLSPCLWHKSPLVKLHTPITPEVSLLEMSPSDRKKTLVRLCDLAEKGFLRAETPMLNPKLKSQGMLREMRKLQVISKPAQCETEVLVYGGDNHWHTQSKISPGSTVADCWFGDLNTKPGATFKIIALTRGMHPRLSPGTRHPRIPLHRTKSEEFTVRRV